jgi:ATP-dependent DNA helicase RecQ
MGAVGKLLRGESDPRLERAGLEHVSTFGVLAEHRAAWLTRVLRRCVTAGFVGLRGEERPVVVLTEAGRRVMRAELPPRIVLPSLRPERPAPRGGSRRGVAAADPRAEPGERALFDALRAHRLEVSRSLGVPPYVVAHDRTLHGLARLRPRTREDLLRVDGIGPAKAERFGEGFLSVVRQHADAR